MTCSRTRKPRRRPACLFNVADQTLFVSIVAPQHYVDGQSLVGGRREGRGHVSAGLLGLILGCGAFGGVLGAAVTKARRCRASGCLTDDAA